VPLLSSRTKEDLVGGCTFIVCLQYAYDADYCFYWVRFDVNRAKEAGISPGPICAKLQQGHSVVLQDGRTVSFVVG
jgi:hypothetical protein